MLLPLQVQHIKSLLFRQNAGDDAWQALLSLLQRLVSKHEGSSTWNLQCIQPLQSATSVHAITAADLARSSYNIEILLTQPPAPPEAPLVFLKTFNDVKMTADANVRPILREIRVCSVEQPDLQHEGLCGISLACHAAAVEVHLAGFGRLGLRGRLPFVALEYCEGLDLYEFGENSKGIPAMTNGLKRKVEDFLAAVNEGNGSIQLENGLPVVDVLSVNKLLQDIAVYQQLSLGLLKMTQDILSTPAKVTFDAFQRAWSDKYDADVGSGISSQVPQEAKACRSLRRFLEMVHDWEWDNATEFLSAPQLSSFWEAGFFSSPSNPRLQAQLLKLSKVAQNQREINCQLYGRLGKVLLNDQLCRSRIFDPCRERTYAMRARLSVAGAQDIEESRKAAALLLENELSQHLLADPKRRLVLFSSEASGAIPLSATWAIFLQATRAVAKMHESGIAHGDIKSENFVLTVGGRVKLIDFGFMHELGRLDPATLNVADFANAPYVSPEFRQMHEQKGFLEKLIEKTGLTAAQLYKANDVWMLGQMLYFLLLRPSGRMPRGYSRFFAENCEWLGEDTWEAHSPDSEEARKLFVSLGLPAEQTDALCSLLLNRIFVPVQDRICDAGQVTAALAELGVVNLAMTGQGDLLHLAWPYFIPRPTLPTKRAGGSTRAAIFEADLDFVQVTSHPAARYEKLVWLAFLTFPG
jgi:hypothetical protein